jgi:hypothetical protein
MANESAQGGQQVFGALTFCQFAMFIKFLLGQIVFFLIEQHVLDTYAGKQLS